MLTTSQQGNTHKNRNRSYQQWFSEGTSLNYDDSKTMRVITTYPIFTDYVD